MPELEYNQHLQETDQQEEKTENGNFSINLALVGGIVGAGLGLLSTQEMSKKAFKNFIQSDFVKNTSQELKKAAQEIITNQAQKSISQIASNYIENTDAGSAAIESMGTSKFEEIKEENKNLNERLDRIEEMLSKLAESRIENA
ncbi:gas vesicle protein GvpP [Neobacillus sp. SCS-31]|uniref:gas vesicle protein GvpP n=1 Tax=Neobacillus oceani TaxID=3115292 RepID=UPI0039059C47